MTYPTPARLDVARRAPRRRAPRRGPRHPAQLAARRRARRQRRHRLHRGHRDGRRRCDQRPQHDPGRRRRRLVAGAMSMAAGEYVSVSTQRDSEQALLAKERRELEEEPEDGAGRARRHLRAEGPHRGARPPGRRAADRARRARARTPRPSSASTPTSSPTRGTPPGRRCSPFTARRAAAAAHDRARACRASASWVTVAAWSSALALTGWVSARLGGSPPAAPWSAQRARRGPRDGA